MDESFITLCNISRHYGQGESRQQVLNNLNGDIRQGEVLALLGRSGCGKSTLLNIIGGIDRPTHGSVRIDGTELTGLDEQARTLFRRRHIGFVYQFFNLLPTLNVADNLLLPLELNGWSRESSRQRVNELLQAVELLDHGESFPEQLSGGEQQRIAVARALAHRPQLILADEPTGNLDAQSGLSILNLLERLVREEHSTMLMVTHSQAVASRADRTLTLVDGRLGQTGTRLLW
jgi:putative ABC transport system ATP-binding protein